MRPTMPIALLLVLLAGGSPVRAEETPAPKTATKRHAGAKKNHSVFLPSTWSVTEPKLPPMKGRVFALEVTRPGDPAPFRVELWHLPGMCEPLPQAYLEAPKLWKSENADDATVVREPRPHLRLDLTKNDDAWVRIHTFHLVRGRGFTLVVECLARQYPELAKAYFAAVDTIETRLGPYPSVPQGYDRVEKDGYVYYLHPQVKKSEIKSYQAYLRKMEKEFRKRHGKFPKVIANELSIVVHPNKALAKAFDKWAGGDREGFGGYIIARRLFAIPLKKDFAAAEADLRMSIWSLLLWRRYGSSSPDWMQGAESLLQYVQGGVGAPLPSATDWLLDQPDPPDAVFQIEPAGPQDDAEVFRKRQALYMALFQTGPSKYRKAYKRCLQAFGAGEDWTEAATEHLLSLDLEKMRQDAAALLATMRKASGK